MAALSGRGRRVRIAISTAVMLGSLGVLGYAGWQLYGTNHISRQIHNETRNELRKAWSSHVPANVKTRPARFTPEVDSPPGVEPSPEVGPQPEPRLGAAYALVRIPRFGSGYEVPLREGVRSQELAAGYGHLPDTVQLGDEGNFSIAAHRVTHGEPLRDMPRLRPGDKVIIETRDATYTYALDTNPNDLVVAFEEVWVLAARPANPVEGGTEPPRTSKRLLTLVTCSELFRTDNRMIAFGHLETLEAKS